MIRKHYPKCHDIIKSINIRSNGAGRMREDPLPTHIITTDMIVRAQNCGRHDTTPA